jgi:hypothetical protein
MLALKTKLNYVKFFIFITCTISLTTNAFQVVRSHLTEYNVVQEIPNDEPMDNMEDYSYIEDGIKNVARGIKSAHILVGCTMEQMLRNTLY